MTPIDLGDANENWLNTMRGGQASSGADADRATPTPPTHQMSDPAPADPQPGTDDDVIVGIVQKFRAGQMDFKAALAALGATSLNWQEAQILLAGK